MKRLAVMLVVLVLFSACATPYREHDPAEEDRLVVFFVDGHNLGKAEAFAAASAWASRIFSGGQDIVLSASAAHGTIITNGAYKWVKAIDRFQTHFQEGWVAYTLTVTVTDSSVKMEFLTGDTYGDVDASPVEARQELSPFYRKLKNSLVREISGTKSDD